jgi:hypothetical protein
LISLSALVALVSVAGQEVREVGTGPAPSPTPVSWEIELKFLDPRRIQVQLPGQSEPEVYWYLVYTATNRSQTTQRFHPQFQLVTEDLTVFDTDVGIDLRVFEAIRERHKVTHPFLVSPTETIGDLKVGEDNARESVAIWRNVRMTGNHLAIYVAGLSGETHLLRNPAYEPDKPETALLDVNGVQREVTLNPRFFVLRKTLELRYRLPGSEAARQTADPVRESVRWLMR